MFNRLHTLCEIDGISGQETAVAQAVIAQIEGHCDYHIDPLGNIVAFKKGRAVPKNRIMLSAHMDEVGLLITGIKEDGMLRFTTVGGIDARVILGRAVTVGSKRLPGVIGTKAVHMQSADERKTAVPADKLYIDIGAKDKDDAMRHVQPGDMAAFSGRYLPFGNEMIAAKALDDRIGCSLLCELLQGELPYDAYFTFCVQEEVGLRGAKAAAFTVDPDIAIVLEATTAADLPDVAEEKRVCKVGGGPVVTIMDRGTIYDRGLVDLAFRLAAENGIPCQTKSMVAGGNDAGAIHVSRGGVRTVAVSLPARYIHSPSSVVAKKDVEDTLRLVQLLSEKAAEL